MEQPAAVWGSSAMHELKDARLADAIAAKQLTRLEHAFDAIVSQGSGPVNAVVALALGMGVSVLGGAMPLVAGSVLCFYSLRMMLCSIQTQGEAKRTSKLFHHPQVQTILTKIAATAPSSLASQTGTAWVILDPKGAEDVRILKKFEYLRHRRGIVAAGRMFDEVSMSSDKIVHRRFIGRDTFTLATHKVKWSRTKSRPAQPQRAPSMEADVALQYLSQSSLNPDYRASRFLRGHGTGFKD